MWSRYPEFGIIVASRANVVHLHRRKQCKAARICKMLVEGSAPSSGACRPALAENDPPDHFPGATGPLKTRTAFCGCSIFLRQMRFANGQT